MKITKVLKFFLLSSIFIWCAIANAQIRVSIMYDDTKASIKFAANDLKVALERGNRHTVELINVAGSSLPINTAPVKVIITTERAILNQPAIGGIEKEGYAISKIVDASNATQLWLIGNDNSGAMYAALDLADKVKIDLGLSNVLNKSHAKPSLAVRGIKFNVPLDKDAESYEDRSTSGQSTTVDVWDIKFWEGFLDNMARHRLNTLSLWNRHPFPHMVDVQGKSVTGVKRKVGFLNGITTDVNCNGGDAVVDVNYWTIQQKIDHWKKVMELARDRGVGVHIFTWNIETQKVLNGDRSITSTAVKSYMKASVKALIKTYPLLAGIGVAAGEEFDGATPAAREAWLWETWGQAYNEALAEQPRSQPLKVTHRWLQTTVPAAVKEFKKLTGYSPQTFGFSHKYIEAHMHSTVKSGYVTADWQNVPTGHKVTLELRDDDFYSMRWGDFDYASKFLETVRTRTDIPAEGFVMGPDGFHWGRESIKKGVAANQGRLFIEKRWYSFSLWGQLSYNASLSADHFKNLFVANFPSENSTYNKEQVHAALTDASKIIPLLTRFYWGSLDLHWNPETSIGNRNTTWDPKPNNESCSNSIYQGLRYFKDARWEPMKQGSQDQAGPWFQSIPSFVDSPNATLGSPLAVADSLEAFANSALAKVGRTQGTMQSTNVDFDDTITDVRAMGHLGLHYAHKIRAAVALKTFEKNTSNTAKKTEAAQHLEKSITSWKDYASTYSSKYQPQQLSRLYYWADLNQITTLVEADRALVGGSTPPPPPPPPPPTPSSDSGIANLFIVRTTGVLVFELLPGRINELKYSDVDSTGISIEAIAKAGISGVNFTTSSGINRTDGGAPYALNGNSGRSFTKWDVIVGQTYTITAKGANATGSPMEVKLLIKP